MKNLGHNSFPEVEIDKQCRANVSITWSASRSRFSSNIAEL